MADEQAVLVTVTGTDEDGEKIALTTPGSLRGIPGGFLLRYEEIGPGWETQTFIECRERSVTLIRAGGVVTTVVYTAGETFVSEYETPEGVFTLRIYAIEVRARRRGGVGRVRLAYQVNLHSDLSPSGEMGMRWLDIRFRPCGS